MFLCVPDGVARLLAVRGEGIVHGFQVVRVVFVQTQRAIIKETISIPADARIVSRDGRGVACGLVGRAVETGAGVDGIEVKVCGGLGENSGYEKKESERQSERLVREHYRSVCVA